MRQDLREIWKYRELLIMFVQRDLKVRYKNSVLGFGWSLANPLMQVAVLTFMLMYVMNPADRTQNFSAYVFCATVPWLFFSTALMDSTNCLLAYFNLIRKTYFPREIIPLACVAGNLIHFALSTSVLLLYLAGMSVFHWVSEGHFDWPILPTVFLIPIPMLGLTLLVTGLAMFISVWTLYFEDVRYIIDSGLKILYWLVPIVYFADSIYRRAPQGLGTQFYTVYMLNPVAGFITAFQKLILPPTKMATTNLVTPGMGGKEWLFLLIAMTTSTLVFAAGLRFFNQRKWFLAERG